MQQERTNSDKLKLRDLAIASSFRFSPSVHLWVMLSINFSDIETPQEDFLGWRNGFLPAAISLIWYSRAIGMGLLPHL